MFETRTRRHPVQTFQFWFVVLTSFVGMTIWKLDLLTLPRAIPEMVQDEPMPPPPGEEEAIASTDLDPLPAPVQPVELASESGPVMSPIARQLAEHTANAHAPDESTREDQEMMTVSGSETLPREPAHDPSAAPIMTASAESADTPVASTVSRPPKQDVIDLARVDLLVQQGEEVAAQRLMSEWYWKMPACRPQLMDRLNVLARRIFFQNEIHYMDPHVVQFGNRLENIAETCRVTPEYLQRLNRLESTTLKVGQVLKVIQGPFSAVVDLSDREMTLHAQGYFVARFAVGSGDEQAVPQGTFHITEKQRSLNAAGKPVTPASGMSSSLAGSWMRLMDATGALPPFEIRAVPDLSRPGRIDGPAGLLLRDRELEAVFDLLLIGSDVVIQP